MLRGLNKQAKKTLPICLRGMFPFKIVLDSYYGDYLTVLHWRD